MFFLLAFLFSSCKKEPAPLYTNSIINGTSGLWQEWKENPNIKVIATGPYGNAVAETGPEGSFIFSDLGNGTYRLDFTKDGYGTIRIYSIQLFGNDTVTVPNVSLFKKYNKFALPELTKINIESFANPTAFISTNKIFEGMDVPFMPVVVFLDSNKDVSFKPPSIPCRTLRTVRRGQGNIFFVFDTWNLPFKSGTEVFLIAYVGNPYEIENSYIDSFLGVEQYSTLIPEKHSRVMSFIMP